MNEELKRGKEERQKTDDLEKALKENPELINDPIVKEKIEKLFENDPNILQEISNGNWQKIMEALDKRKNKLDNKIDTNGKKKEDIETLIKKNQFYKQLEGLLEKGTLDEIRKKMDDPQFKELCSLNSDLLKVIEELKKDGITQDREKTLREKFLYIIRLEYKKMGMILRSCQMK